MLRTHTRRLPLISLGSLLFCASPIAEEIDIPSSPAAQQRFEIKQPPKGMNQEQVVALFGKPQAIYAAVGEPPIIRWRYADYTVYFEAGSVIHSVAKDAPALPKISE